MLSFSKPKLLLLFATGIVAAAFLMASITMFFQDQPPNTTFICFISSMLAAAGTALLALDVLKEINTMKVVIKVKKGLPVSLESLDMDEAQLRDFNNRLARKKLTNRDLMSHIIHYYETRKASNIIKPDGKLQILFSELDPIAPTVMPHSDEGDIVFDEKELCMTTPAAVSKQANEKTSKAPQQADEEETLTEAS